MVTVLPSTPGPSGPAARVPLLRGPGAAVAAGAAPPSVAVVREASPAVASPAAAPSDGTVPDVDGAAVVGSPVSGSIVADPGADSASPVAACPACWTVLPQPASASSVSRIAAGPGRLTRRR